MSRSPDPSHNVQFEPGETFARQLDAGDPLASYRACFHLPTQDNGRPLVYLCSHSLGLQPIAARAWIEQELESWATLGVGGHFKGPDPWYTYGRHFGPPLGRLVGAAPEQVVLMNGLTVNLHLLMETFYRPAGERTRILIDEPTFPSDLYAVKSQIRRHGLDPESHLLIVRPRPWEPLVHASDLEGMLEEHGQNIALVLLSGVNFFTGQFLDMPRLTALAHAQGCLVGFDLAHAIGNVPLALDEWQVDFAVWCTYKYLCGGPGSLGGCYVRADHASDLKLPRLAGWWGNDPATRFRMQLEPEFVPQPGAAGWQVSNPPILALAPLRAALDLYADVGMSRFQEKARGLTSYLLYLLARLPSGRFHLVTPREPERRGCMICLRVNDRPQELFEALASDGVIGDFRQPDVIRVAPMPFYNTFHDVWSFVQTLARHVSSSPAQP